MKEEPLDAYMKAYPGLSEEDVLAILQERMFNALESGLLAVFRSTHPGLRDESYYFAVEEDLPLKELTERLKTQVIIHNKNHQRLELVYYKGKLNGGIV